MANNFYKSEEIQQEYKQGFTATQTAAQEARPKGFEPIAEGPKKPPEGILTKLLKLVTGKRQDR